MRASLFVSLVLFSLAAHAQEVPPPIAAPQNISQSQGELNPLLKQIGAVPRNSLLSHFHKTPTANDLIQRQKEQIQQQNERILREREETGAIPGRPLISSSPQTHQRLHRLRPVVPDSLSVGHAPAPAVPPPPYPCGWQGPELQPGWREPMPPGKLIVF